MLTKRHKPEASIMKQRWSEILVGQGMAITDAIG